MRRFFITATAIAAVASPAAARDGTAYFGVDGGILFPKDMKFEVDSVRIQTVPTGNGLLGQTVTTTTQTFGSGFVADYKRGVDLSGVAGYDFGFVRLEAELGYKRARMIDLTASSALIGAINTAPISGVAEDSFDFGGRTTVQSGMANALVDFGISPGISLFAGGGVGRARVKAFGGSDKAWAGQLIAGVSTALSGNLDMGLKYRYFQTRELRYDTEASFTGLGGSTSGNTFSNEASFRSHSLLLSLMYNFGAAAEVPPPPPMPVEVAPPPPPPATQTCPDGSINDAMSVCPAPPPPPPPPPAPPIGERG